MGNRSSSDKQGRTMPNQRSKNVSDYKLRKSRRQYHACRQMAAAQGKPTHRWMRETLAIAAAGGKDALLNQKEAAELLGVCDWTLRHDRPSKGLQSPRIMWWGRLAGYNRDELLAWASEYELGKGSPVVAG